LLLSAFVFDEKWAFPKNLFETARHCGLAPQSTDKLHTHNEEIPRQARNDGRFGQLFQYCKTIFFI
jgi:hypothetical protein